MNHKEEVQQLSKSIDVAERRLGELKSEKYRIISEIEKISPKMISRDIYLIDGSWYVRVYVSGGIMIQGCGLQNTPFSPVIAEYIKVIPPMESGSQAEIETTLLQNNIMWVRSKGYVCTADYEDASDIVSTYLAHIEEEKNKIREKYRSDLDDLSDRIRYWTEKYNKSFTRLREIYSDEEYISEFEPLIKERCNIIFEQDVNDNE